MTLEDLFAVPTSLTTEFDGATIAVKLRPPTQVEQGRFSRYLEDDAIALIERRTELPEERRDRMMLAVRGRYSWGTDLYTEALGHPRDLAKMLGFIIQAENAQFANCPEDAERLAMHLVVDRVVKIAAVLAAGNETDPDKKKDILQAAGLSRSFLDSDNSSPSSSAPPSTRPSEAPPTSPSSAE